MFCLIWKLDFLKSESQKWSGLPKWRIKSTCCITWSTEALWNKKINLTVSVFNKPQILSLFYLEPWNLTRKDAQSESQIKLVFEQHSKTNMSHIDFQNWKEKKIKCTYMGLTMPKFTSQCLQFFFHVLFLKFGQVRWNFNYF